MDQSSVIWLGDGLVRAEDAKIPVLSPTVKYGINVFEGLRCYADPSKRDLLVFRISEHLDRLQESMRMMRYANAPSVDRLRQIVLDTIRANDVKVDTHVRLSVYVLGEGTMDARGPISVMCALHVGTSKPIGERTVRAQVSAWRRIDDQALPPRIKNAANYANGRLALMQARDDGYDEALFLTREGHVSEAAAACLFIVRKGAVITPPVTASILESITRESLIEIAREEVGLEVVERNIDRTELYTADEVFLCGSAYEVTPVVGIDRLMIGDGSAGPVTLRLWDAYLQTVGGLNRGRAHWITSVYGPAA
jgi:branched-chain amino acid aminotransferase